MEQPQGQVLSSVPPVPATLLQCDCHYPLYISMTIPLRTHHTFHFLFFFFNTLRSSSGIPPPPHRQQCVTSDPPGPKLDEPLLSLCSKWRQDNRRLPTGHAQVLGTAELTSDPCPVRVKLSHVIITAVTQSGSSVTCIIHYRETSAEAKAETCRDRQDCLVP